MTVLWQGSECSCVLAQNPIQAIVQHSEHNVLYAQDPLMQGFHARYISHMLDIVCENQGPDWLLCGRGRRRHRRLHAPGHR